MKLVASIDQGTTGTTVLLFDGTRVRGKGYQHFTQSFPAPGQVEHDPEEIWKSVIDALAQARAQVGDAEIAGIGITNQRETTVLWDRHTGRPVAPAIVWQDRRTAPACEELRRQGKEPFVREATGLLLDPYFSATKIGWLLDNVPGVRRRAERGEIAFGTIDAYLLWRLSGGRAHLTDPTNASRTLLFDWRRMDWSDELCGLFGVPRGVLPQVQPSVGKFVETRGVPGFKDGTPVMGVAGDQQAALYGQRCFQPGDAKCTYGTGAFLLMNVGDKPVVSRNRLIGTVAWQIGDDTSFALEGSLFIAGALIQWLRDGLGLIAHAKDVEELAASVPDAGGVMMVPALAGLGAPHWRPEARGAITGITRGTTGAHFARAALDAIALQTVDLVRAMAADAGYPIRALRVDGGAAANDLLMQIQADLLDTELIRPDMVEATALGAARLAAKGLGIEAGESEGAHVTTFHPKITPVERQSILARWEEAVAKA